MSCCAPPTADRSVDHVVGMDKIEPRNRHGREVRAGRPPRRRERRRALTAPPSRTRLTVGVFGPGPLGDLAYGMQVGLGLGVGVLPGDL
jgi:hypothetical protein